LWKLVYTKKFWLILLGIVVILVLIKYSSATRSDITFLEKIIRTSYTPLQSGVTVLKEKWQDYTYIFTEKKELQKTMTKLEKELNKLKLENQKLREYQAEVMRLRKIIDFKNKNIELYETITARVIARSPNNWNSTLTIDKGSNAGLKKDMPVISPDGLVGKIKSVSWNSAQVSLISDREMAVGAINQDNRETNGIVEGMGKSDELRMINIPYYSSIKTEDVIVTSGLSDIYPGGLDIGIVKEIEMTPNGLLLTAFLEPAVDFNKLEEVLVITEEFIQEDQEVNGVEE